jgi:hypothetical protein
MIAKNKFLIVPALLALPFLSLAQTVNDVLEKGKPVDKNSALYLQIDDHNNLFYAVAPLAPQNGLKVLPADSTFFLLKDNTVNVFLKPMNPLRNSYADTSFDAVDQIDKAANDALSSIGKLLTDMNTPQRTAPGSSNVSDSANKSSDCNTDEVVASYNTLLTVIKNDQKEAINKSFSAMEAMSFNEESETRDVLDKVYADTLKIAAHYDSLATQMTSFSNAVAGFSCTGNLAVFLKFDLGNMLEVMKKAQSDQLTRYSNLQKVIRLVAGVYVAAKGSSTKYGWWLPAAPIVLSDEKFTIMELSKLTSGYSLSNGEIVVRPLKVDCKKHICFRPFQRFVREVIAGVAYTGLRFPKYGTATDSAGVQRVASAGEDDIKRLNFNVMVNYVYYSANTNLRPLLQVGIGASVTQPVLLCGGGFRFSLPKGNAITITGGIAFAWIQTLDKLKIGDQVSGTAQIQSDLKYEFNSKPQPYLGIQLKL